LSVEVPATWPKQAAVWSWSPAGVVRPSVGVSWADLTPGWAPTATLPVGASVQSENFVDLGWAQGTQYQLAGVASADGVPTTEIHVVVPVGQRAYDFALIAGSASQATAAAPVYDRVIQSIDLPNGAAKAEQPLTREPQVWDAVQNLAGSTVQPILKPSVLPTGLNGVRLVDAGPGSFVVEYRGPSEQVSLGAGAFSPPPLSASGTQQSVTLRGISATLQLANSAKPGDQLWLWWSENGLSVPSPQAEAADTITYTVSATGVDPAAIENMANALLPPPTQPVATVTATPVPTEVPTLTATPTAVATPVAVASRSPTAAPATGPEFTSVAVYLIALNGGKVGCGDGVVSVVRQVPPTRNPLTAALQSLFAIRDQTYGQSGLYNALYRSTLQVDRVVVSQGVATIWLTGQFNLGGECDNPRVAAQLDQTALQFATVKNVVIYVNGKPLNEVLSLK
jgi:spore germination protein GerM